MLALPRRLLDAGEGGSIFQEPERDRIVERNT